MATRTPKDQARSSFPKLQNYQHPDAFGRMVGYTVDHIDRKEHVARLKLKIRAHHLSPAGKVHGGAISAFFDFACGAAVFSTLGPRDYGSTVEMKVNYLRPLELGDEVLAIARVIFRGKRLCVVHGFLYRNVPAKGAAPGAPVAMVTATFNVVSAELRSAPAAAPSPLKRGQSGGKSRSSRRAAVARDK